MILEYQNRLNALFQSGRYQCDLQFYQKLSDLVRQLNLYEYQDQVHKNLNIVKKISTLTTQHSNSLIDDYDEENAIQMTKAIQDQLIKIDTKSTEKILRECNKMNGQSYKKKIVNLMKKCQYGKQYLQIAQRNFKNINSENLKIDNLLMITLYMIKNKHLLKDRLNIYKAIIDKGMLVIKENISKIQQLQKIQIEQQHQKIFANKKVITFIKGTFIIINIIYRFYNVYKVLEGRSNLSFKLNSFKQFIDNIHQNHPEIFGTDNKLNHHQQIPIEKIKQVLKGCKDSIQIINSCCCWCLRTNCDSNDAHKECAQVINLLSL